jgi:HPt (histidine-containing phosphotransfer) domain-containing protein
MKFIDFRLDRTAAGILAADTFEQLQEAFYSRLRQDRERLAVLRTALTHCGANLALPFEELASFAHRLRGAAAIFGAGEIRDAAHELEVAAHAARERCANEGDSQVGSALALLADLLTAVTDETRPPPLILVAPARVPAIGDTQID